MCVRVKVTSDGLAAMANIGVNSDNPMVLRDYIDTVVGLIQRHDCIDEVTDVKMLI